MAEGLLAGPQEITQKVCQVIDFWFYHHSLNQTPQKILYSNQPIYSLIYYKSLASLFEMNSIFYNILLLKKAMKFKKSILKHCLVNSLVISPLLISYNKAQVYML